MTHKTSLGLRPNWNAGILEKWNNGFWDNGILVHGKIRVFDIIKYG
jgi:hypothetical protein